ncbi:Metallocarboxypeptidase A-like protein [Armadillidium vulgare]|nr:Metallocarboxypeptidase A-like protein [Armadillidium vulgare]
MLEDRMWRKNRNKYDGPSAASEPETQATQAAIIDLAGNANLEVLYSLHSYSELWMYAFGWDDTLPEEANELDRVTAIGVDALAATPLQATLWIWLLHGVIHSYLELRDKGLHGFLLPEDQIFQLQETWAGLIAATLAV